MNFFMQIEQFTLTSQTKSPNEILKILIFNILLEIPSVIPNRKDHEHSKHDLSSSFFFYSLSIFLSSSSLLFLFTT
jgi:hypothetical protein